jgi:uncharacterized protein
MNTYELFRDDSPNEVPVHGFLHRSPDIKDDWLILTHGAGSNCNAPLLVALADRFSASGLTVLRCDLPYRQTRPHGPPPRGSAERDQQGLAAAVAAVWRQSSGRVYLGGHSYGGRQASMLAADQPGVVDGLLLLSYPLHPPQKPDELRTAHFPRLQTPALFVSGNHDGFGSIDELRSALTLIPARTELLTVTGAGHELLSKKNRDSLPETIVETFQRFAAA